jgi:hypothetical protein
MDLRPPAVTQARHRLKRRAVLTRHIPAHLASESKRCVGGSSARNLIRVAPLRVELFQREHLTLVADERKEEPVLSRGQLDGMHVELDLLLIEVDVQGARRSWSQRQGYRWTIRAPSVPAYGDRQGRLAIGC